jgi:hypothetical protein
MIGDKREESDIGPKGHTGKSPMQIFLYVAGPTPKSLDAIANLQHRLKALGDATFQFCGSFPVLAPLTICAKPYLHHLTGTRGPSVTRPGLSPTRLWRS